MKDLDLTLVKVAQEKNAEIKNKREYVVDVTEEEKEGIRNRFYQNSIQTPEQQKRQQIHGSLYVGSKAKSLIAFVGAVAAVAATITAIQVSATIDEINHYNVVLDKKIESELTDRQALAYEKDHDNFVSNVIEAYEKINDAKDDLNPEDYNARGENITNHDNEYIPFDEDAFTNLTEESQDAIDQATDDVISEYKRRG